MAKQRKSNKAHMQKYLHNSHAIENRRLRAQLIDLEMKNKCLENDMKCAQSEKKLVDSENKRAKPFLDRQSKKKTGGK